MLCISQYPSQVELAQAHHEIRSFRLVHAAQKGIAAEETLKALRSKRIQGDVFQVGDYFYQAAEALRSIHQPAECACFHFIGDNPYCPIHGKGAG